jgi:beta-lactamase superfamily II metal-dependent hydrolase
MCLCSSPETLAHVYKVHHHCSQYSTNPAWLEAIQPTVAIISTETSNTYKHPAKECLARLRKSSVNKVYWTTRDKAGKPNSQRDIIADTVVVEVARNANMFTVWNSRKKTTDTFPIIAAQ